jgi:sulfur relay protein TusB/DsrH
MSSASDTLHCVVRGPGSEALRLALACAASGDVVLLLQDGVHAAFADAPALPAGVNGHVLMSDVLRRGLDPQRIRGFVAVDEAEFVALARRLARQVCWA